MMEQLDLVEFLREKTGCSYSEARAALAETGENLLDALCWLESHGKTQMVGAFCSTDEQLPPDEDTNSDAPKKPQEGAFLRGIRAIIQAIADLIRWGNRNALVIHGKNGNREMTVPLTILALLLIAAFWVIIALIAAALFCGFRFRIEGPAGSQNLNDAMGKATDFAEGIREEVFPREDQDE